MNLFFISSAVCENEGKDLPALRDQACEAGVTVRLSGRLRG
jgi:hypothetical protein